MAEGDIGPVIATGLYDAVRGYNPSVRHVAGNVYACAFTGPDNDGWVSTVSVNPDGSIGAIIDTLEFNIVSGETVALIHIAGNVWAIAYWQSTLDDGIICTLTIDNAGNIGGAIIDTLTFDAVRGRCPDIIYVAGDVYAIAYTGPDDDGWLGTVSIDNLGNIGAGFIDTLEFDGTYCYNPKILHVSGDVYAIAYASDVPGNTKFCTMTIDNAGNIGAAVIDSFMYPAPPSQQEEVSFIHVSGNVFAVVSKDGATHGWVCTINIDNLGNIGAAYIDKLEFDGVRCLRPSIIHVAGDIYVIAYQGPGPTGQLCTLEIDNAGNIGAVIDTLEFDNITVDYPFLMSISGDVFAVFYARMVGVAPGWIRTFTVEIYSAPTVQTDPATGVT